MQLADLINGMNVMDIKGDTSVEITGIAYDSRKVRKGSLFVCIDGVNVDGHSFIPQALTNGASALLVQKEVDAPAGITVVRIENTRYGMAYVADAFYGHPSGKLNLVGVTGTKGKTTTAYMIKSILEAAGQRVGLIGTIENLIGNELVNTAERTTPESLDLQALFSEMSEKGCGSAVMEVSSQGLNLHRVSCSEYDIGIFTNISPDHIGPGEHTDFQDYLNAKKKLFSMCKKGIVNIDSEFAREIMDGASCGIITFGIENQADIMAYDIEKHSTGVLFSVKSPWFQGRVKVNIPGLFNVYNALAAIGASALSGIGFDSICRGLETVRVKGRLEVLETGRTFVIMIDYAHNAVALENVLTTVKEYAPGRVVTVFGCGGNKDRSRRFGMGEVSGRLADFSIITSDNPRSEAPEAIIADIETGILKTNGKYIRITERREAIRYAMMNAQPGDIIILAGKGHETYQIFDTKTIHFDEREVVAEILEEMSVAGM